METTEPRFSQTLPPLDLDGRGTFTIDPSEIDWKRVSPRYVKVRLISRALWSVFWLLLAALPLVGSSLGNWAWPLWLTGGILALVAIWQIWLTVLVRGRVKAIGYSERRDHLLKTNGVFFRKVRAIPYGRIQYVDVTSGPLESRLKLARVVVNTASSASISIPGLPTATAEQLRETLTDLSDAKMVGL